MFSGGIGIKQKARAKTLKRYRDQHSATFLIWNLAVRLPACAVCVATFVIKKNTEGTKLRDELCVKEEHEAKQ